MARRYEGTDAKQRKPGLVVCVCLFFCFARELEPPFEPSTILGAEPRIVLQDNQAVQLVYFTYFALRIEPSDERTASHKLGFLREFTY